MTLINNVLLWSKVEFVLSLQILPNTYSSYIKPFIDSNHVKARSSRFNVALLSLLQYEETHTGSWIAFLKGTVWYSKHLVYMLTNIPLVL